MLTRTYRVLAAPKLIDTELPEFGSNVYVAHATMVEKLVPSVLPCTESVCVRALQPVGSLSTTWAMDVVEPRSIWVHCGNAPLLSQYVA